MLSLIHILSAACAGFLFGLNTAYAYINSGVYKKVLVIGADIMTRFVDWKDRGTCVLFGDGAGAVVLEASETGLFSSVQYADGSRGKDVYKRQVLGEAVYQYQKKTVRKMILKDHKRPDGRAITEIRPLAAETDIIPRVHGSAMFTRDVYKRQSRDRLLFMR